MIEPLSAALSVVHLPVPLQPFLSSPARALTVVRLRYFPSRRLRCALTELTCVEQCGWKSFFLMSWSLTSFLYLFQNQNKKSSLLDCLLHLLFFFFPRLGSNQNGAEDAAAVGNRLLIPCEIQKHSGCSFFPHSIQARLCEA